MPVLILELKLRRLDPGQNRKERKDGKGGREEGRKKGREGGRKGGRQYSRNK